MIWLTCLFVVFLNCIFLQNPKKRLDHPEQGCLVFEACLLPLGSLLSPLFAFDPDYTQPSIHLKPHFTQASPLSTAGSIWPDLLSWLSDCEWFFVVTLVTSLGQ
jgi:hypothetical protein